MTRFKAFGIHLGISLAIFILVLGLLILVWYPSPLFDLEGGWDGIKLVALVDVVLGPVLTLVLFKVGKPGLKFDMAMVVLMQVGALIFGMWNLYEARPVLLVHADDHFRPISRALLADWEGGDAVLAKWEGLTPQRVRVDLPLDAGEFADLYHKVFDRPGRLHALADRYQPLEEAWPLVLQDAVQIESYVAADTDWAKRLETFVASVGREVSELAFFPYYGRHRQAFLVFDRQSQDIVAVLDLPFDPANARFEVPRSQRVGKQQAALPPRPASALGDRPQLPGHAG